ncbi:hypothetical protein P280DRAFT_134826 [Massarina eburnea CBS 473.64]|uniref:RRM domain-containing protein n=1 Tax=Massarina eburnea CBS 473.64 TaxID=1395130 RepID=A0A6A6RP00_9PLEO|nr:hypothetical protein P280DRAFT_134826 [Massarina eburnea CBS 473.64]
MAPPSAVNGTNGTSAANGVIPMAVLQKNPPASAPRGPKALSPRLKLVCRRLPPGLTKTEFENFLGAEWKVGAGKIDWLNYKKGKISKDVAKPSRPALVHLHVTQQAYVVALGDHIRDIAFHDATKSYQDSALVGPPALEYAPYPKLPGGRRRNDARQGTIDQDPEFKEFLESLTAPITKPAAPEADPHKDGKVKTTPLIEALREKKANKDKPQGKSKGRGETKEGAAEKKVLAKPGKDAAAGEKNRNLTKAEREKAQKEAVKALTKEAASLKAGAGSSSEKTPASSATPERKRGNVNMAKSILQHDLGLGPAPNRRRGTKREVTSAKQDAPAQDENAPGKQKAKEAPAGPAAAAAALEKNTPASPSPRKERPSRAERRAFKASLSDKTNSKTVAEESKTPAKPTTPAPTILKKPQAAQPQTPTAPKGPAAARAPPTEPAAVRNSPAPTQASPPRPVNPTPLHAAKTPTTSDQALRGKQAFLKHANASQGITEPLIEDALKAFGAIENVEIDRRKGFAYVDFADPESLAKAIKASPVKVAQGAVQVLERKDPKAPRRNPYTNQVTHARRPEFAPRGRPSRRAGLPGRGGHLGTNGGPVDGPSAASTPALVAPRTISAGGDAGT